MNFTIVNPKLSFKPKFGFANQILVSNSKMSFKLNFDSLQRLAAIAPTQIYFWNQILISSYFHFLIWNSKMSLKPKFGLLNNKSFIFEFQTHVWIWWNKIIKIEFETHFLVWNRILICEIKFWFETQFWIYYSEIQIYIWKLFSV